MTALMWITITLLALGGIVGAATLAALQKWVAFMFFVVVYVIAVVAFAVQAVLTTN